MAENFLTFGPVHLVIMLVVNGVIVLTPWIVLSKRPKLKVLREFLIILIPLFAIGLWCFLKSMHILDEYQAQFPYWERQKWGDDLSPDVMAKMIPYTYAFWLCYFFLPAFTSVALCRIRSWRANAPLRKLQKAAETNKKVIPITCGRCGNSMNVNSVFGGTKQKCKNCGNRLAVPTYQQFLDEKEESTRKWAAKLPDEPIKIKKKPDHSDLESAIVFFSNKAKKIHSLEIDEDEKEMLLMKLQEKKEKVMEQYV